MRRWKEQAENWKAIAEALERRAMRAEADLAACTRSRDDPAVGFLAQLQHLHEDRTKMKQQIRRAEATARDCLPLTHDECGAILYAIELAFGEDGKPSMQGWSYNAGGMLMCDVREKILARHPQLHREDSSHA